MKVIPQGLKAKWFWYSLLCVLCWGAWVLCSKLGTNEIPASTMQFIFAFGFIPVAILVLVMKSVKFEKSAEGHRVQPWQRNSCGHRRPDAFCSLSERREHVGHHSRHGSLSPHYGSAGGTGSARTAQSASDRGFGICGGGYYHLLFVRIRSYAFAALVLVWSGYPDLVGDCWFIPKALDQLSVRRMGFSLAGHRLLHSRALALPGQVTLYLFDPCSGMGARERIF